MGELGRFKTYWQDAGTPRGAAGRGNLAEQTPESVAQLLRNERLVRGYQLSEVARALNIREGHLDALEEGRFGDLPPLVYAKGFVDAYARFLELDRAELVARFTAEATNDNRTRGTQRTGLTNAGTASFELPALPSFQLRLPPMPVDLDVRRRPGAMAMIAGALLLLFIYSVWSPGASAARVKALEVPPLPSRFTEAPAPAAVTTTATGEIFATPLAPVPAPGSPITIKAYGEGWVQLHNMRGDRVASVVLRQGEIYKIPAGSTLKLSTGNLASIAILVGDQVAPLATPVGRSRTEVVLDPVRLMDGTAVLN
jgi:cytoskeleton protein RodZ